MNHAKRKPNIVVDLDMPIYTAADLEAERDATRYEDCLRWRDVEVPCERCEGRGIATYGSTATWMGGIGGAMITSGVCDSCWGTGDMRRIGANLRDLMDLRKELAARAKEVAGRVEAERDALKAEAACAQHSDECAAQLLADIKEAEENLAAIRSWATEERPSIPKCLDPGHDDRWCSHCDSMLDGVGHAQARVLRILDVEAPDA